MKPFPICLRIGAGLFLSLFAALPAVAQNAAPRLPDMSAYDCAQASAATATRHIGQVINGQYQEWNEFFVTASGQPRLACIGMIRPSPRQLSADEARAFLTASFAVGAPTAARREQPQSFPDTAVEPSNVQPEPLKRLRKAPALRGLEQKSGAEDLPPVPASKTFDETPAATTPPTNERTDSLRAITPADGFEAPKTVGIEDREQITSTQTYPWNTLAYLSVTYPSSTSFRCSAALVSPYVALTAGHCVHNKQRGGYVQEVRLYPGQTQNNPSDGTPVRPYGSKTDYQAVQTTLRWTEISGEDSYLIEDYRHDLAAIQFRTAFTHTGTFMPVMYSSTGSTVTGAGYPAAVGSSSNAFGLYSDAGDETSNSLNQYRADHVREFAVDGSGGNSGGPFIYQDPATGQRYLVGLLSYAEDLDDQSGGPWYDSWNQALVSGWVQWTPSTANAGSTNGLRVASVFGSAQPSSLSYLRFYNAGTSAGTVQVTLADYVSGTPLATWTSPSLPGRSSRQFSIAEIEAGASTTFTKPLVYSLSLRPTFTGAFQNALWRKLDATLTNLSTCDSAGSSASTLINVHSSLLNNGYPSAVVVHNTGTGNVSLALGIYNAQNGQRLGTYQTANVPANGQLLLGIGTIEAGAGINANAVGAYHYNIRSDTTFTGYMQHLLNNQSAGVVTDMSTSCALTP